MIYDISFVLPELAKLGPDTRGYLFIQLANFPNHYLVIVITDERFRFALITTSTNRDALFAHMVLDDIAWLDYDRIHKEALAVSKVTEGLNPDMRVGMKKRREEENTKGRPGFPE